jgi:hypothetical protein
MPTRKSYSLILLGLGSLLVAGLLFIWPASPASAQCGSQASSCKSCHEVQAQDPVNADGTGWHQSHAFGDFCYMCHAGNPQSTVKDEAHAGMVAPLSDVNAACAQCHPADLMDRAQVYAAALGVEVGEGGSGDTGGEAAAPAEAEPASQPAEEAPAPAAMVTGGDEVVDYVAQYDETVKGVKNVNWGNVVLGVMIVVMGVGGGGFVYQNERRLRGLPILPLRKAARPAVTAQVPVVEGYSTEVTALLPQLARLNPVGLHSLKKLLADPDQANELLHGLSNLDPELVRRIRNLDAEARSLLLALAGG